MKINKRVAAFTVAALTVSNMSVGAFATVNFGGSSQPWDETMGFGNEITVVSKTDKVTTYGQGKEINLKAGDTIYVPITKDGKVSTLSCGKDEHKEHGAGCYEKVDELKCKIEENHVHTDECYNMIPGTELICQDKEHTHTDECYGKICDIKEHAHTDACYGQKCSVEEHTHTDACYPQKCDIEEHTHTDACYGTMRGDLTCVTEEHAHTDACYPQKCDIEEHTHSEACCTVAAHKSSGNHQDGTPCTCAKAEHAHADGSTCNMVADKAKPVTCGKEEHAHVDGCYTQVVDKSNLICTKAEHAHGDGSTCNMVADKNQAVNCGKEEHIHGDGLNCTMIKDPANLICKEVEHAHGDGSTCNMVVDKNNLICTEKEHKHEAACFKPVRDTIKCDKPENHKHEAACFEKVDKLTCTKELHAHDKSCYKDVTGAVPFTAGIPDGWQIKVSEKNGLINKYGFEKYDGSIHMMFELANVVDADITADEVLNFHMKASIKDVKNKVESPVVTIMGDFSAYEAEESVDMDFVNSVTGPTLFEVPKGKNGNVEFDFENGVTFKVKMHEGEKVLLDLDTTPIKELYREFDADMDFYNFLGEDDEFVRRGELSIKGKKGLHMYEYDGEYLYELDPSYVKGRYVIKTDSLGCYILADEELDIKDFNGEAEKPAKPAKPAKPSGDKENPGMGAGSLVERVMFEIASLVA